MADDSKNTCDPVTRLLRRDFCGRREETGERKTPFDRGAKTTKPGTESPWRYYPREN
jgi:hypothetical protein